MARGKSDYTPVKELLSAGTSVLDLPKRIKITKTEVDSLPLLPKGLLNDKGTPIKQIDFRDIENKHFGVRVSTKTKTYFVLRWVRNHGKETRVTIGVHGDITADKARTQAGDIITLLRQGVDVNEEEAKAEIERVITKQEAEEAESKELTVKKLATEYLEKHAKVNKRESSTKEDERLLNKDVLPCWGDRKAKDIRKRDVALLLEEVAKRGPALTHNVFKLIRRMFNFAVERDILEFTPCTGIKINTYAHIVARERVLKESKGNDTVDEIFTFWTELEKASMSDQVKRILRLILITGQRPGEVAGINASEVNGNWWTIPIERRKTKMKSKTPPQPHRVYLSKLALETMGDQTLGGFYFPSPVFKTDENENPIYNHIDENAVAYAVRRNLKNYKPRRQIKGETICMVKVKEDRKMDIEHFTPHDLRRTCSTRLAELGFSDELNDAVLGHTKKGIVGIYNRYQYDKEKQMAMEAWERKLISIITGNELDNVIPITKLSA